MIEFLAKNGDKVELSFAPHPFPQEPEHVLVICRQEDSWLLTRHKKRGLEFPGGKVEPGETLEEAARREVFEETGAILRETVQIASYRVMGETDSFVKAVFCGQVAEIKKNDTYFETSGPVLIQGDLLSLRFGNEYSFIMQDRVVKECLTFIFAKERE